MSGISGQPAMTQSGGAYQPVQRVIYVSSGLRSSPVSPGTSVQQVAVPPSPGASAQQAAAPPSPGASAQHVSGPPSPGAAAQHSAVPAPVRAQDSAFDAIDLDKDGVITREEFQTAFAGWQGVAARPQLLVPPSRQPGPAVPGSPLPVAPSSPFGRSPATSALIRPRSPLPVQQVQQVQRAPYSLPQAGATAVAVCPVAAGSAAPEAWSVTCSFRLGVDAPESPFQEGAVFFDKAEISSVKTAIAQLNSGQRKPPEEGFLAVFSQEQQDWYALFRAEQRVAALRWYYERNALRVGEGQPSASREDEQEAGSQLPAQPAQTEQAQPERVELPVESAPELAPPPQIWSNSLSPWTVEQSQTAPEPVRVQAPNLIQYAEPEKPAANSMDVQDKELYSQRSALYRFRDGRWALRGVGEAKLVRECGSGKTFFVFRKEETGKRLASHFVVGIRDCCNLQLNKDSQKTWVWKAEDCDGSPATEHFALKLANVELAQKFREAFESAREESHAALELAARRASQLRERAAAQLRGALRSGELRAAVDAAAAACRTS